MCDDLKKRGSKDQSCRDIIRCLHRNRIKGVQDLTLTPEKCLSEEGYTIVLEKIGQPLRSAIRRGNK